VTHNSSNSAVSDRHLVTEIPKDMFKAEHYFPTLIFSVKIPDSALLNARMIAAIYAQRERDRTGIRKSNFPELGGWHSHVKLHKDCRFGDLVRHIDATSDMMCSELGYHRSYRLNIGTMWSIINPPGGFNRAHIHPGCLWSGVYYVQAPSNSGSIEFRDPRTQNLMSPVVYLPNTKRPRMCWRKVQYKPVAGRMLIFPSWLYHSVNPNRSRAKGKAADRIIVSFNLSQKKRT